MCRHHHGPDAGLGSGHGDATGDIDPGLPGFLAQTTGMTAEQFHSLVNHESGCSASRRPALISATCSRGGARPPCGRGRRVFFYHAKKAIEALAAALGGLDILVFSGGIGEILAKHVPVFGLEFLGIALDPVRNQAGDPVITADGSPSRCAMIRTDEESMIARDVNRLLAAASSF